MKKINYNKCILLFVFLVFLIISFFMPYACDDWGNVLIGSKGIANMFWNPIKMYFEWEGRIVSRLIINIFTYYKFIFNIAVSGLLTGLVYIFGNMFKTKNKTFAYLLSFLALLLLENSIRNETILWVAGSITYLFPTILVIGYLFFYYMFISKKDNYKWHIYLLSGLFSFVITMFVENIALSYVFINIFLLGYEYYKTKKFNKLLLLNLILSIGGTLLMLLSPGSAIRNMDSNTKFTELNIFGKIGYNYSNFVYYSVYSNSFLLVLFTISNYFMLKKIDIGKIIKNWIIIITSLINLLTIVAYVMKLANYNSFGFMIEQNIILSIYWTVFSLEFIFLIFKNYKKNKLIDYIFLLLVGLSSNIVMLASPIYGARTTLFTVIFLLMINIYIIDDFVSEKLKKKLIKLMTVSAILISIAFIIIYYNVFKLTNFLEESIKKELANDNEVITIYTIPGYLGCEITPRSEYHVRTFKDYYKIPQYKKIVYNDTCWRLKVIFDQKKCEKEY